MAGTYNEFYNVAAVVTPSDTNNIIQPDSKTLTDALWVGTGGDVVVIMNNGVAVTFGAVPDGGMLPIGVKRVNSTSTTASNIVALWTI